MSIDYGVETSLNDYKVKRLLIYCKKITKFNFGVCNIMFHY